MWLYASWDGSQIWHWELQHGKLTIKKRNCEAAAARAATKLHLQSISRKVKILVTNNFLCSRRVGRLKTLLSWISPCHRWWAKKKKEFKHLPSVHYLWRIWMQTFKFKWLCLWWVFVYVSDKCKNNFQPIQELNFSRMKPGKEVCAYIRDLHRFQKAATASVDHNKHRK